MSSYNSGQYGGGYDFEDFTTGSVRKNRTASPDDVMYDEGGARGRMSYGRDFDRDLPPVRKSRPQMGDRDYDHDEFDDYRPGTMYKKMHPEQADPNERSRARAPRSEMLDPEPRFDDDFDDEIVKPAVPPHQSFYDYTPPPRRGYSRDNNYGDNYGDEDFEREFGGIKGLGVRRRPMSPQEERFERERREMEEQELRRDEYYGRATMRDQAYDGSVGVPKIFADYFRDDYVDERRVIISGGVRSKKRFNKALFSAIAAVMVLALSITGIVYLFTLRVTTPLNVSTALSGMGDDTSGQLLKYSVDEALSARSISVAYTGENGKSGKGVFNLVTCGFEYSTLPDGTVEYIEVQNDDGTKQNHTFVTMGTIRFDETLVREYLNQLVGTDGTPMIEPTFDVKLTMDRKTFQYSGELKVKAGSDGYGINYDKFIQQVISRITTNDYRAVDCTLEVTHTPDIDVDAIYDSVRKDPVDAYSVTDGAGVVSYFEHVIGQDFDKNSLKSMISSGGTEWSVDLLLRMPDTTIQELRKYDFPDLLASYSTIYRENNAGRTSNIKQSVDYINGTVLEPLTENPEKSQFSFNGVVGERTPDRGFTKATVYSSEGTDEDYGGGICQVSSTLYYTAILANLQIDYRRNHLFTVGYMTDTEGNVTFSNDATVNWGLTDFKFSNSKQYPIKIEMIASGGVLTCNIWGTWDGYTADFGYQEISTEPYKTTYRPAQDGKSSQAGQLGRVIDTYRIVYYEGEKVDKYFEHTSSYLPLGEIKYTNNLPAGREYGVEY